VPKSTLTDVTVIGKAKTPAEKMVESFMGGWFDGQGYLYDGMSNDEITTALSVFDYLMGKVPGLQIYNNKDSGGFMVNWRGFEPAYFIDGMETDQQGLLTVATSEIAVIKVIRPPFYGVSMGSAGGAILILTKKGQTGTRYGNKFRYVVNGYTPQEYTLY
jgi:TonB-dependent Receptor Plug Domain